MNDQEEPAPCTCTGPGQCYRAGRFMSLRDFELCSGTSEVPSRRVNLEMSATMRRFWDAGSPMAPCTGRV